MDTDTLKETLKRELPELLRTDPQFRDFILDLTRSLYADRDQTETRFDRILNELQRDREQQALNLQEQRRQWDEQNRKWDEQKRQWDEQNRKWEANQDEQKRQWDEQNHKWDEQNRKWEANQDEQKRQWDEQNRKWEANQLEIRRLNEALMAQSQRHDRSIGALGARWGLQSERTFRNALAAILQQSFGVKVVRVDEYDTSGEVFGRPDQIELDVIIKNGLLIICELKSSISKSDMYTFERKARFYERLKGRKADRLMVISPMIDDRALSVAQRLGIETYSDSLEVSA